MILPDVNVLLFAFRRDAERHDDYRSWLDTVVNGESAYGISPQVLASVIRIGTHRRIYVHPSRTPEALPAILKLVATHLRATRARAKPWRAASRASRFAVRPEGPPRFPQR